MGRVIAWATWAAFTLGATSAWAQTAGAAAAAAENPPGNYLTVRASLFPDLALEAVIGAALVVLLFMIAGSLRRIEALLRRP